MTEPTGTRDHVRILNGIVHCAHCSAPLLKAGTNYSCPTVITDRTDACPTKPIDGQELLYLVVDRIIGRTINDQTMDQIVVSLKSDYGERTRKVQDNLDRTESAIAELNVLKTNIVQQVEQGAQPFSDVSGQIEEINQTAIGLSYEARLSRRKIDEHDFVTDEDRIRANAQDLSTYLGEASPDDTKELIDMFVNRVDVGTDSVVIHYTDKVPGGTQSSDQASDRVPLPNAS